MADFYLPYTGEKIVEILRKVDENGNLLATTDAYNTNYDNSQSGLSATKVQSAIDEIVNENVFYPSLMMFVTNANTNSLDIAFGKNNESEIHKIGKQLAMYAWFKGDSRVDYPFINLIQCDTLQECLINAFSEIEQNNNLMNIISASPYALQLIGDILIPSIVTDANKLKVICSDPIKSSMYKVLLQSYRNEIITTLDSSPSIFTKQSNVTYRKTNGSNNLQSALLDTNTIVIPIQSPKQVDDGSTGYGTSAHRYLYYGADSSYKIWNTTGSDVRVEHIFNITESVSMRGIYYSQAVASTVLDPAITCDVYTVI